MHFHISEKVRFMLISFAVAFVLVMILFIKFPNIVKSKNKIIRAVMVFAIAFVPGVMAASICAKTIVTVYDSFLADAPQSVVETEEESEEIDDEEE